MTLQTTTINGHRITALPMVLEAFIRADADLKAQGIGRGNTLGLVFAGQETCSWRSLALQQALVAKGASMTTLSNHRRGTACDVAADWDYIGRIGPTMRKYGLINDLAFAKYVNGKIVAVSDQHLAGYSAWDGGHFNWQSNTKAASFPIIDKQEVITEYTPMQDLENKIIQLTQQGVEHSGSFAIIIDGKRRVVSAERMGLALATIMVRENKTGLSKAAWDAIPDGGAF